MKTTKLALRVVAGAILLPVASFLTGGPLAATLHSDDQARRVRLEGMAKNLGLDAQQLIDPAGWEKSHQLTVQRRLKASLEKAAKGKPQQAGWRTAELDDVKRQQAVHTLAAFLSAGKQGGSKDASQLPPEVVDLYRKLPPERAPSGKSVAKSVPNRTSLTMEDPARKQGVNLQGWVNANGGAGNAASQGITVLRSASIPLMPPTPASADIPQPQDTAATIDADSTNPLIVGKAHALNNDPISIYRFVHDEINVELYAGSKKGAVGTLREGAGNDYDQSSLLVALLRAAGVPARYEVGVVALDEQELESMTGVQGLNPNAQALASAGIGSNAYTFNDRGRGLSLAHAWVKAYVPTTAYRGIARPGTAYGWVPLAPAIKRTQKRSSVDLRDAIVFDLNAYLAQPTNLRPSEAYAAALRKHIKTNNIQCETLDRAQASRFIVPSEAPFLPSALPVRLLSSSFVAAELPDSSRHKVRLVGIGSQGPLQFEHDDAMPRLWGKSVTLTYEAATPADQSTLNLYGGVDGTPAYLVKMRAVVRMDGVQVTTGIPETLGSSQQFQVQLISPATGPQVAVHDVTVGGIYAVALDAGIVPSRLVDERHERIGLAQGDQAQAEKLYVTGLTYFRELGLARNQIAGLRWHRVFKEVEEVLISREPRVVRYGSTPLSIARDFFVLDAAIIRSGQASIDGDDHRRADVSKLVGLESSFLEHRAGELFYGPRQFSAVKLLQLAGSTGVPVVTFGSSNLEEGLEQIHWPEEFEDRMADAVNQGLTVQAPVAGHPEPGLGALFGFIATEPTLGTGQYIVAFEVGTANATVNGGVGDGGGGGSGPGSECNTCGGDRQNGSSVNLYTGNYVFQETDLTLPAVGIPLSFTRTYSAQLGWHHNYDQHINAMVDGSLDWVDETGVPRRFAANGSGIWVAPARYFQTIEPASGGGYRMVYPDGMVVLFDSVGRMLSETDLNGNQVVLAYGPSGLATITGQGGAQFSLSYQSGRLSTITDSAGRSTSLSFNNAGQLTDETDVLGNPRHYTYDSVGRLVTKTDRMGNVTRVAYDDRGRLVQVQDPEGGQWSYAYDAKNAVTVETDRAGAVRLWELGVHALPVRSVDPLGNETVTSFDAKGNKTAIQDARGLLTSMTHDGNGNILSRTEPTGAVTTYSYGAHSRLLTSTDAELRTTTNSYDSRGNLHSTLDPDLNLTSYSYTSRGLPQTITRPGGATTSMEYDTRGNVTAMVDPVGGRTTMSYDSAGHMVQMEDPNHRLRTMAVDAAGRMLSMKDPSLAETKFSYDPNGNRLTVTDPENHITTFTYDKASRLRTTKDALGNITTQEYDAAGRVVATKDARGFRTETTYDKAGRVVATKDASGATTRMNFCADLDQQPCEVVDAMGNVMKVVEDSLGREVARIDPLGNTTATEYDLLGRRTKGIDPAGKITEFKYDTLGRLTEVKDAIGGVTKYGYDNRGNRVSVQDANQHTTTFAYDLANRLTTETTPVNVTEFIYDVAGNRTGKRDGKNQLTSFDYDQNRRLSQVTYAGTTTPAVFGYDVRGNKISEGNGDSHRTMTHDALGRVSSVFDQETGRTIEYTYDPNGNRKSMRVTPDNETTTYDWDARNQLVKMVDPEGGVYHFAYDPLGRRTRAQYPNGMRLENTYDAASRVVSMVYRDRVGAVIESFTYTYDTRGNRTSKIFADGGAEVYGYDDLSRLIRATYPSGRSVGYTYDAVGNRTQMVEGQANQALATCYGDADCDGVVDAADNCPQYFNPAQEDSDVPALSKRMAGAFSFEEVSGNFVVKDSTGNSNGTTVNTGVTRDGKFGSAMNFQSIQGRGYITVPNNPALQSVSGTALTLAAWVRPRDNNGNAILGKSGQFQFMWGGDESSRGLGWFGAGPFFQTSIAVTMPNNVWSHVAVTYDGEALRFYVNGELVDSKVESGNVPATTHALLIGCLPGGNSDGCNIGSSDDLDEVGLWPRVLSQSELQALQTQPLQASDHQGDACDVCPGTNAKSCAPVTCLDGDGDGYGVVGATACGAGSAGKIDCNDSKRGVNPSAVELCNGIDDDCDGRVDEACLNGAVTTTYSYNAFNQLLASGVPVACAAGDGDCDGTPDAADNCPATYNPNQKDSDAPNKPTLAAAGAIGAWNFNTIQDNQAADLISTGVAQLENGATTAQGRGHGAGLALNPNGGMARVAALGKKPATAITVEAWVKGNASGLGTAHNIVNEDYFPEGSSVFGLSVTAEGKLRADFGNVLQYEHPNLEDSVALVTDQWVHVAGTYDGEMLRLYKSGVLAAETKVVLAQALPLYSTKWFIGGDNNHWDGLIDDVAIYPRALTAAELAERAKDSDAMGDACDACPNDASPSCVPATCLDSDHDGYGVQGSSACAGGATKFDCNDANAAVHPGVAEVQDGIDNDCNGVIDGQWAATVGLTHYAYDANGNQTIVDSTSGGVTEYVWDARDRLREVHAPGGAVSKYGYDTANLRVRMDEGGGAANVRRILLDGIEEMAEYAAGDGARAARYDHDPTRVDALMAQVTGNGVQEEKVFAYVDALGSVYGLVGGAAHENVKVRFSYDVFGARTSNGEQSGTRWGFTGRRHDLDGHTNSRNRYYKPMLGRFSNGDPAGLVDGPNRYAYSKGNPSRFRDPTGLCIDPGGSGPRICIEAFIPAARLGPLWIGHGDDRSYSSSGGTFRTRQFLRKLGKQWQETLVEMGRSMMELPIGSGEELYGAPGLGAVGLDGSLLQHYAYQNGSLFEAGVTGLNGFGYVVAPPLGYQISLNTRNVDALSCAGAGGTGLPTVDAFHTPFPAFEVWLYADGAKPTLLYGYDPQQHGFNVSDLEMGLSWRGTN